MCATWKELLSTPFIISLVGGQKVRINKSEKKKTREGKIVRSAMAFMMLLEMDYFFSYDISLLIECPWATYYVTYFSKYNHTLHS